MPLVFAPDEIFVSGPGDAETLTMELVSYVPPSWTSPEAKQSPGIFWGVLSAFAQAFAVIKGLISQASLQLRVKTASGSFLDIASTDYFGTGTYMLPRLIGEADAPFRNRILATLLQPKATVPAIIEGVAAITGAAPTVFEPFNVLSTGAWGGLLNPLVAFNAVTNPFVPYTFTSLGDGEPGPGVGGGVGYPGGFGITRFVAQTPSSTTTHIYVDFFGGVQINDVLVISGATTTVTSRVIPSNAPPYLVVSPALPTIPQGGTQILVYSALVTLGEGVWGDLGIGSAYNWYVTVTNNPNQVSQQAVALLLSRIKPIGTTGHLSMNNTTVTV